MNELQLNFFMILGGLIVAAGIFVALFFIRAPYGRHIRPGWGPVISNRYGWLIMESPSALVFAANFAKGDVQVTTPILMFFVLWELHYVYRAFIYPLTIRDGQKKMPMVVMALGFCFNFGNAYINGRYLFSLSGGYSQRWLFDPRFILGGILFLTGLIVNRWADLALRGLRKPGETGYQIPQGGLFRLVSCPNYLGEIVQWWGWAVMTWSLPGLAFALWTFANLAPRARSHHEWYHANFVDYPPGRKALFPWIW